MREKESSREGERRKENRMGGGGAGKERGKEGRGKKKIPCAGHVCLLGWQARSILGSQFFAHPELAQTKAMLQNKQ